MAYAHTYSKPTSPRPDHCAPLIVGCSSDIPVDFCKGDCEIRADVMVSQYRPIRIWGQIINCNKEPVPNVLVKLVKVICGECGPTYKSVAQTTSDCKGYYDFSICTDSSDCYRIIVGKPITGKEIFVCKTPPPSPSCDCECSDDDCCDCHTCMEDTHCSYACNCDDEEPIPPYHKSSRTYSS